MYTKCYEIISGAATNIFFKIRLYKFDLSVSREQWRCVTHNLGRCNTIHQYIILLPIVPPVLPLMTSDQFSHPRLTG